MVRVGWSLVAFVLLTIPSFATVGEPSAGMTYARAPDGGLSLLGFDPQGGTATMLGTEPSRASSLTSSVARSSSGTSSGSP